MATYTPHKKLELPTSPERYNIGVFNKNNTVIDSELHKLDLKNASQDSLLATKEEVEEKIRGETDRLLATLEPDIQTAKAHAVSVHARTDATRTEPSETNGSLKIDGVETNVYTHPAGPNPHGVTKGDLGLAKVENKNSEDIRNELTMQNVVAALGYTPPDADTDWNANTKDSPGCVAAGQNHANKVWKTDGDGNPAWREEANGITYADPEPTALTKNMTWIGT